MSRFWSPIVETLVPYTPGEQPGRAKFIKLNTNENPYGPSPHAVAAVQEAAAAGLQLYPDPVARELRRAIAARVNLSPEHVFAGNGSDEILAHAFNAFFRERPPVLFADVTYSFYRTYCKLYQVQHREVPLADDFRCDPANYRGESGGVVIANPNAPTGLALSLADIETVLLQNPDVVVLVDEAYVDFGAESAVALVPRYENLLVVQTFSKSRSLAGLRVGFAVAHPDLIEGLVRVKDSFNSYPLGRPALAGALAAWEDEAWFEETRTRIMADRERTARVLETMGFRVLPSTANFLFISHPEAAAEQVLANLRARGILVRHFRQERIRNWLRITIGTADECDALVTALRGILADLK